MRKPRRPRQLPFDIVHEDDDLLVLNKPPGFLTSSGPRDKRPTMINILREFYAHLPVPVGLIHRLDRDAAGLIVFSKNAKAFRILKHQFFDRSAGRVYHARVEAKVKGQAGEIIARLHELPDGRVVVVTNPRTGEDARTRWQVLQRDGDTTLMRIELDTGRKHQIRVHLAHKGWPIVGDVLYNPKARPDQLLHLLASQLTVVHPRTNDPVTWALDLPEGF
jgi:23S rRNA pseudouridine1911/1915/1917 synthase